MATFYVWGSTVSRIQSHYEETIHSLLLSLQDYLVLISSTSKEWRLSRTWKHLLVLNQGPLDLECSISTIRSLLQLRIQWFQWSNHFWWFSQRFILMAKTKIVYTSFNYLSRISYIIIWCICNFYQKYTTKICLINLRFLKFLSWILSSSFWFFLSMCVNLFMNFIQ